MRFIILELQALKPQQGAVLFGQGGIEAEPHIAAERGRRRMWNYKILTASRGMVQGILVEFEARKFLNINKKLTTEFN
jgi:hypothetical protein